MTMLIPSLRWLAALVLSAVSFFVGLTGVALVSMQLGPLDLTWAAAIGTLAATVVGALVAPPQHHRVARLLFIGLPVALIVLSDLFALLGLSRSSFTSADLMMTSGAVLGAAIAWRCLSYRDASKARSVGR